MTKLFASLKEYLFSIGSKLFQEDCYGFLQSITVTYSSSIVFFVQNMKILV